MIYFELEPVSSGFLMDVGGDDFYFGGNGSATAWDPETLAAVARALLFDAGGFDWYGSSYETLRTECTVAPKSEGSSIGVAVGAQIDFPHTDCPT